MNELVQSKYEKKHYKLILRLEMPSYNLEIQSSIFHKLFGSTSSIEMYYILCT